MHVLLKAPGIDVCMRLFKIPWKFKNKDYYNHKRHTSQRSTKLLRCASVHTSCTEIKAHT